MSASPGPVDAALADLRSLDQMVEATHPDQFGGLPEAEWRAAVSRLEGLIPELVPDQPERLYVEFLRLVALPGVVGGRHGHASAGMITARPLLGIVTYTFADGVYVIRAVPEHQDLVGGRVTAVEGTPIEEVRALVEPLITRDNEWTPEIWFSDYLRQPEVLVGVGVLDAVGPVELTVDTLTGETRTPTVELTAVDSRLAPGQDPMSSWAPVDFLLTHYLPRRDGALWVSRMDTHLWWTTIEGGTTLFVQQTLVEPPTAAQLQELLAAATQPGVRRVVLDLRHNMGGEDATATLRVFQDERIDQPGRLFVITSTNVFSAATPLASGLDLTTSAVFVGEPIGGAPAFFSGGSHALHGLPIPLEVSLATGLFGATNDERLTIEPDIAVPLLGADYFGDVDRALEAILAYKG